MKKIFRSKKFIGFTSAVLAASIVVGSIAVSKSKKGSGITVGVPTVHADDGALMTYDSAGLMNYTSVLGRAIDYGIVSTHLEQRNHMETTYATSDFFNQKNDNCDVDLAGDEPAQFIIASISGGKARFGYTYGAKNGYNTAPTMQFVIDTTPALKDSGLFTYDAGSFKGEALYRTFSKGELEDAVQGMVDHITDESNKMLQHTAVDGDEIADFSTGKGVIDLTDESYKGAAVYINVLPGSKLERSIQETENLQIKKDPSTVVIFNILNPDSIKLAKYVVISDGKTMDTYTDHSGNDTQKNQDIDEYITRKIIWNIPYAKTVSYDTTAGLFILPNPDTVGTVTTSSAGWIAAAGTTVVKGGEFHYIYHGRSEDANTVDESVMHFAMRKAFVAAGTPATQIKNEEIKNIHAGENQYTFSIRETDETYQNDKGDFRQDVSTDEDGKVVFQSIRETVRNVDPYNGKHRYFVITEKSMAPDVDSHISKSNGEIRIDLYITNVNGIIHYKIYSWKYADSNNISATGLIAENPGVDMAGTEFSLGGFYNYYDMRLAKLSITKVVNVEGTDAFPADYEFSVAIKKDAQYVQDEDGTMSESVKCFKIKRNQTLSIENLVPGTYTIDEIEDDVEGYSFVSKQITVNGSTMTDGKVVLGDDADITATLTNNYKKVNTEGKYTLKVNKNVIATYPDGMDDQSIDFKDKIYTFTVRTGNRYLQDRNGTLGSSPKEFSIRYDPTSTDPDANSIVFYGLDPNAQYTVSELRDQNPGDNALVRVPGYSFTSSSSDTTKNVTMSSNNREVELTNRYSVITGRLTINKQFVNYNPYQTNGQGTVSQSDLQNLNDLKFNIHGPKGYSKTLTWADIQNGRNVLTNVPVGQYTIEEENAEATSKGTTTFKKYTYVGMDNSNSVSPDYPQTITVYNQYEDSSSSSSTGSISIDKHMDGEHARNGMTVDFAIKNENDQYLVFDSNGRYTGTSDTPSYATLTFGTNRDYVNRVFTNIPLGRYTIEEVPSAEFGTINGKKVVPEYTVDGSRTQSIRLEGYSQVQVRNHYREFNLEVSKKVFGDLPYDYSQYDMEYEFVVKKGNQYVQYNGDVDAAEYVFKVKPNETISIPIARPGDYQVIEKTTEPENSLFTLETTYSPANGTCNFGPGSKEASVSINNTYTYKNKGALEVTKTVSDPSGKGPTGMDFTVGVTLDRTATFNVEYPDGTTAAVDFVAGVEKPFILKDGESVKITGIYAGTGYTVSETALPTNFLLTDIVYGNTNMKIQKDVTDLVTVKNQYDYVQEYGELSIEKVLVSGNTEKKYDPNTEYTVNVQFDTAGTYDVSINGAAPVATAFDANTDVAFPVKAGDTIVISNIPVDVIYTVTEADPTGLGYSKVGIDNATGTITTTPSEVKVNNKYEYVQQYGELSIEKVLVSGETEKKYDPNTEYTVNVQFDTAGTYDVSINGAAPVATAFAADTDVSFTVKAGDTIVISNIPEDAVYTVTEADPAELGYSKVGIDNGTGTITTTPSEVKVNNKYEYVQQYGNLKIRKEMQSGETEKNYDPNMEYTVYVRFDVAGTYDVSVDGGTAVGTIFAKDTDVALTIKAGQEIEIANIPEDANYTISEADPAAPGYSKFSILNPTGTIDTATKSATVYNKYEYIQEYGELTIEKVLVSGDSEKNYDPTTEYTVYVQFDKAGTYDVSKNGGAVVATAFDANTDVAFTVKAGDTINISNIPVDVNYTVTEADPTGLGYSKVDITNGAGMISTTPEDVKVNNKYEYVQQYGELSIEKVLVSGETEKKYDPTTEYTVNVQFDTAGTYDVSTNGGAAVATAFDADTDVSFTVKAGDTIVISNIPEDANYIVSEVDPTGLGYSKVGIDNATGTITTTPSEVKVNNKYEYVQQYGNLKIRKEMQSGETEKNFDPNMEYTVYVQFDVAGTYDVSVDGGTAVGKIFAKDTDVALTIKAGQEIEISNIPEDANYIISEADPTAPGYSKFSILNPTGTIDTATKSATVYNKYEYIQEYGELTIEKVLVSGDSEKNYDSTTEYTVNVQFDTAGTYLVSINGSAPVATAFAADTDVAFNVKAGDRIEISNIPVDVNYTVTEADPTGLGYSKVDITNGTGTISTTPEDVKVNNKYEYVQQYGELSIEKVLVSGETEKKYDPTTEYTVNVQFNTAGTYDVSINGAAAVATAFDADTDVAFTVRAGDTIVISNIPEDTNYIVTEVDPTELGYSKVGIDNATGTITTTPSEVKVNNRYEYVQEYGSLIVEKVLVSGETEKKYDPNTEYTVNVQFDTAGTYDVSINGAVAVATVFDANTDVAFNVKAGDTIEISNIPVDVEYTVTEVDPTIAGYSKVDITNGTGTISTTAATATVNNKYEYIQEYGELSIEKVIISGETEKKYDANTEYTVNVQFDTAGSYAVSVNGAAAVAKSFEKDTDVAFTMKAGDTIVISNIPDGVKYTVTEADPTATGYSKVSIDNATGTITTTPSAAVVNNKYEYVQQYGSLKVKKVMADGESEKNYDPNTEYTINVQFDTAGTYDVSIDGGTAVGKIFAKDTDVAFTIKAGQEIEISNIPEDVNYTVSEVDPAVPGYSKFSILNPTGTIDTATKNTTVYNKYEYIQEYGELSIEKVLVSGETEKKYDANTEYTVNVQFDTAGTYDVAKNGGAAVATAFAADTDVAFTVKAGDTIVISNIPVDVKYTVTEVDPTEAGYSKVSITDGTGTITTTPSAAVVNNKYEYVQEYGELSIEKVLVSGATEKKYNANTEYTVNVQFDTAGTYDVAKNGGTAVATAFAANTDVAFTVKAGDTIVISNIPVDVKYTVTEADPTEAGYSKVSITNGTGTITTTSSAAVVNNKYEYVQEYGNLKVEKVMTEGTTATGYNANTEFTVNVQFDTAGTYDVAKNGGAAVATAFAADTDVAFTLKAGDYIEISNIPVDVKYTVSEVAPTQKGYSEVGIDNATGTIATALSTATVNNKYDFVQEYGSLKVEKVMTEGTTAKNYDANTEFTVNVQFDTAGTYGVAKNGGTAVDTAFAANTNVEFTLKAGDSIVIGNIPVDAKYTVSEVSPTATGYSMVGITGATGTITKAQATATVNNKYEYVQQYGSLSVQKVMSDGTSAKNYDANTEFTVNVQFDTAGTYDVAKNGGAAVATAFAADTDVAFTMKAGDTIVISNIPEDAKYTVSEEDPATPGYSKVSILNATGTIDAATKSATVYNKYEYVQEFGQLTFTKVVAGTTEKNYNANTEYTVNVQFDTAGTYDVSKNGGAAVATAFAADTDVAFTVKNGDSIVISNIPADVKYTVTEEDPTTAGYSKVGITNGTGTISTTAATATVNNKYEYVQEYGQLTVKKVVAGTTEKNYDANTEYTVNVQFDTAGTYDVSKNGGAAVATAFAADTDVAFTVKNGDTIVISNIPVDVKYTVTEEDPTTAGYSKVGITNGTGTISTTAATATVNNKYEYVQEYGQLTVEKVMTDGTTDTGYNANTEFTVNVQFDTAGTYDVSKNGGAAVATAFAADTDVAFTVKAGDTIVISNIPVDVNYTVSEVAPTTKGYSKVGITNGTGTISTTAATATVNNKYSYTQEYGSLKVEKTMTEGTTATGYNADTEFTVRVKIEKDGTYDVSKNGGAAVGTIFAAAEFKEFTLKAGEYIEISKIPVGTDYTVEETDPAVKGYSKVGIDNATGTITTTASTATVKNKYEFKMEYVDLTVKKVWNDNNNQDGIRPAEVTVELLADSVHQAYYTLNEGNNWTAKTGDLPKTKDGYAISYTWKELSVKDYTSGSKTEGTTTTFTNTHAPILTDLTVKKVWEDEDNKAGKRPLSLTVTLSNGDSVTLDEANGWTATIKGLPVYDKGSKIEYSWTEEAMPEGYTMTSSSTEGTVTTITNTYKEKVEKTSATVKKVWADDNNKDGKRPAYLKVKLSNGTEVTLSEANGWTETVNDLPRTDGAGNVITYTWSEPTVPEGYELTGNSTSGTVTTLTNTLKKTAPERGSLVIEKVLGAGAPASASEKTYTFTVKGPNGYQKTVTIKGAGTVVLSDLELGTYTVTEDEGSAAISGYELTVANSGVSIAIADKTQKTLKITNSYTKKTIESSSETTGKPTSDSSTESSGGTPTETPSESSTKETKKPTKTTKVTKTTTTESTDEPSESVSAPSTTDDTTTSDTKETTKRKKQIKTVTVDDTPLGPGDYTVKDDDTIELSEDVIQDLRIGIHRIVITYDDDSTVTIEFEVISSDDRKVVKTGDVKDTTTEIIAGLFLAAAAAIVVMKTRRKEQES